MCTGLTADTITLMTYDREVISLASVLGITSKNLILRTTIAGQIANGRRWTINGRIPVVENYNTRNSTESVVEKALRCWIQDLSD
jgi:hypothetical protein